jgi:hypothetical protein
MEDRLDRALDALAHAQRRRLLQELLEADAGASVAIDAAASDRSSVSMRHVHLPKLESYGFVDWDPEREVVTRGPNFDDVRAVLEALARHREEFPGDWT